MYIGNVLLLVINLPMIGVFVQLLKTPMYILMPLVAVVTLTGAYSINNSIFDLGWVIIFGVIGFLLRRAGFEPAPLVIGLVLGPELERGLAQGLIISNGNVWTLISRPISATILSVGAIVMLYNTASWFKKVQGNRKEGSC